MISDPETGTIGNVAYTFPTLKASSYYVWNDTSVVDTKKIGSSYAWERRKYEIDCPHYDSHKSKLNKR